MDSQNAISQAKNAADQNNFKAAQKILKKVLTQDPRNVEAWLVLAEVVEKPDLKIKSYEQVLKIDPDNDTARQKLFSSVQEVSEFNNFEETISAQPQTLDDRLKSVSEPSTQIDVSILLQGIGVFDAFRESGLCKSNGEARRLMNQGGLYLNQEPLSDPDYRITKDDFKEGSVLLRAGKKRYHRFTLS